jgi:hypothetical protein
MHVYSRESDRASYGCQSYGRSDPWLSRVESSRITGSELLNMHSPDSYSYTTSNTLGCSLIQKKHVHHLADYRIDRAGVFALLLGFSSCIHTFRPTCFWARCPSCGAAPHGARWGSLEKATA